MMQPPAHVSTIGALVRRIFGTDVRMTESFQVIGTSEGRIAPNDPKRVQLHVVNNGTSNVYYSFLGSNQPAVIGSSDFIPPGGFITWLAIEDGETVGYELRGVSSAVGNTLDVQEYSAV